MSGKSPMQVDQIDHVEMFVPDRYQAAEWYGRVLGLQIIPEFEFWAQEPGGGPLMISSDEGSTKLALFHGQPPWDTPTAGFHRVAFRVGAVDFIKFINQLSQLGLRDQDDELVTPEMVVDHEKSFSIYFSDPYGHRLEVTTYEYDQVATGLGV